MELLLPAGNFESVIAAVQNGADAVYFGGKNFNARRNASNFDDEFLKKAIDYCALRGVKTYLTLNTLVFDKELNEALNLAKSVYEMGIDAVIIQDLGLARVLKNKLPDLELHASTQLGVHDTDGASLMKKLGFTRVVLARETPLEEIKRIHDNVDIDLEAFAHGAMCVSFSGHCLFSSMVGQRSGNRGKCAQPCRKIIEADPKTSSVTKYDLSLADMCMIEHLQAMKDTGIDCLKIEGRMKRSEYVAVAAKAYRTALDGANAGTVKEHKELLKTVFDRGGFCTANYFKDDRRTGCVATSCEDEAVYENIRRTYEGENKAREVYFSLKLVKDEYPVLVMKFDGMSLSVVGEVCAQKAQKPMDIERIETQLKKLGGTVFECKKVDIITDNEAFLPISEINELRRKACKEAEEKLLKARIVEFKDPTLPPVLKYNDITKEKLLAEVTSKEQAIAAFLSGADEVSIILENVDETQKILLSLQEYRKEKKLLLTLPHVVLKSKAQEKIKEFLNSSLIDGAIANNIGQTKWISHLELRYAGAGLNIFNTQSASCASELGFNNFVLSHELTKPQMRDILNVCGGSVSIYGKCELMQLTHCVLKEHGKCKNCKGDAGKMVDADGRVFKLRNIRFADECVIRLLNCDVTDIRDLYKELPTETAVLTFSDESEQTVSRIIKETINGNIVLSDQFTRGHYNRAVE
ncbi:MAG: U32 family peptidase [Clostridia bacterium]|nr:U32 family peptidase [Clostridia bacterium]